MSGPLALVPPVVAQVLLTLVLLCWMGWVRGQAVRAGRVRIADVALSQDGWPADVRKVANNYHNQFETPVLFYVLCALATYLGVAGVLMALLAWAFIATRLAHSFIHVTTNRVRHRFIAFAAGVLILALMWILVLFRLMAG